jgi:hypothetical protein
MIYPLFDLTTLDERKTSHVPNKLCDGKLTVVARFQGRAISLVQINSDKQW